MIISHKYKYIFVKTRKTAGTSVEISLSRFCGKDDIITPVIYNDELIRSEMGIYPQNYGVPVKWSEYSLRDWKNLIRRGKKPAPKKSIYYHHITAKKIRDLIGEDIWNSYFKFCFVRNPWDRAVSRYYWNIEKTKQVVTMDESLQNNDPDANFPIYTIDGEVAVDFVGRFENLMEDTASICERLNIPFDNWLPRTKNKSRKSKKHYSEILNPEQIEYIREKCAAEIELFGYEFEQVVNK
ncbi:MAG: sulfotransferase family 2 domain-containing protein [Leptolyngbya sp. SIO1E4]|nr:sulfotransferase family 2 domain-containing protein [Leptolyngbya sp. SIO1E4]